MSKYAIASRVFQFRGGPHKFCFHACAEHKPELNTAPSCFMEIPSAPIVDEDIEDEIECDLCQREPRDPDRDEAYERAAARDRLDDFARTGGKDWT
jgi:hypothetical protein